MIGLTYVKNKIEEPWNRYVERCFSDPKSYRKFQRILLIGVPTLYLSSWVVKAASGAVDVPADLQFYVHSDIAGGDAGLTADIPKGFNGVYSIGMHLVERLCGDQHVLGKYLSLGDCSLTGIESEIRGGFEANFIGSSGGCPDNYINIYFGADRGDFDMNALPEINKEFDIFVDVVDCDNNLLGEAAFPASRDNPVTWINGASDGTIRSDK